jgi:hypothetical protein
MELVLGHKEEALQVTSGYNFVAVATSCRDVCVFSTADSQLYVVSHPHGLIQLQSSGNNLLLAVEPTARKDEAMFAAFEVNGFCRPRFTWRPLPLSRDKRRRVSCTVSSRAKG